MGPAAGIDGAREEAVAPVGWEDKGEENGCEGLEPVVVGAI